MKQKAVAMKKAWKAPSCSVFGDVATLTQAPAGPGGKPGAPPGAEKIGTWKCTKKCGPSDNCRSWS